MLSIIRIILVALGSFFLMDITGQLFGGHITYSVGEVGDETVTTETIAEALSIWVAFGSMFVAMIIAGVAPKMYLEKPWLWKTIIALIFSGYVLGSILK